MGANPLNRSRRRSRHGRRLRRRARVSPLPTGALAVAVTAIVAGRAAAEASSLRTRRQAPPPPPTEEAFLATTVAPAAPLRPRRRRRLTGGIAALLLTVLVIAVVVGPAVATDSRDTGNNLPLTLPPDLRNAQASAVGPAPAVASVDSANPTSDPGDPSLAPATSNLDLSSSPTAAPSIVGIPTFVDIPAVGIHAPITPLGLGASGVIQVPDHFDQAGWFSGGPRPGDSGPAVILGHVDSRTGPAVFFRLKDLQAGDTVTVTSSTGTERFIVDSIAKYPKTEFPTQAVYGPVSEHALRLVTCGGQFDHSRGSYLSNIIVFATAAP